LCIHIFLCIRETYKKSIRTYLSKHNSSQVCLHKLRSRATCKLRVFRSYANLTQTRPLKLDTSTSSTHIPHIHNYFIDFTQTQLKYIYKNSIHLQHRY